MSAAGLVASAGREAYGLGPPLRRLSGLASLDPDDRDFLAALIGPVEVFRAGQDLVGESSALDRSGFIVSGWACRQRLLPDGRRQIFGILLPGDAIGLCRPGAPVCSTWTVCLTKLGYADAAPLRRFLAGPSTDHSALKRAMTALEGTEEARLLDQVVRLGRHTAHERVAHLLLELYQRLQAVGMTTGPAFPMPLTQETLADVLGLSVVHVNRVLQQLKRERLIELRAGRCTLLEPALLANICDFAVQTFPPMERYR